jgi:hypothetical protein
LAAAAGLVLALALVFTFAATLAAGFAGDFLTADFFDAFPRLVFTTLRVFATLDFSFAPSELR